MALHCASKLIVAVMSGMYMNVTRYFASIPLGMNFGVRVID